MSAAESSMGKPMKKVYICSSCRLENYEYVTDLLSQLGLMNTAFFFRPQPGQLKDKQIFADVDVDAINSCDEVWVMGRHGRDCSWEIGYAAGIQKPVKVYMCDVNAGDLENDWMMFAKVNKIERIDVREALKNES